MAEGARPTPRHLTVAALCLVVAVGTAFVAASVTRNERIFSLSPPVKEGVSQSVTSNDIPETRRLDLHRTFFTAWAALLLVTPALCLFPFHRTSPKAAGYWLAFWTAGFLAFLVHLYWAIFVIFDGDWSRIATSPRVSAPVIDIVFAAWWGLDVLLVWIVPRESRFIKLERAVIYMMAAALFVAGSAIEGEIWLSKAIGFISGGAVALSLLVWFTTHLRDSRLNAATPST